MNQSVGARQCQLQWNPACSLRSQPTSPNTVGNPLLLSINFPEFPIVRQLGRRLDVAHIRPRAGFGDGDGDGLTAPEDFGDDCLFKVFGGEAHDGDDSIGLGVVEALSSEAALSERESTAR